MTKLLLKTKDGRTHQGPQVLHCLLAEDLGIKSADIIDTGFLTKGNREIWLDRSPHYELKGE